MAGKKIFSALVFLLFAAFCLSLVDPAHAQVKKISRFPFFIYSSQGEIGKCHFFPTGKMGDIYAVRMWGNCRQEPQSGASCIKVVYDVLDESRSVAGWAGVYWQMPANNWGKILDEGYDLSGAKKAVFYARGENGGEAVSFCVGGITGPGGDSARAPLSTVRLTKEWKRYEIPLQEHDLSRIIGGFCWSLSRQDNPGGAVFYLDEIYFE
jgi:hypothetical protein